MRPLTRLGDQFQGFFHLDITGFGKPVQRLPDLDPGQIIKTAVGCQAGVLLEGSQSGRRGLVKKAGWFNRLALFTLNLLQELNVRANAALFQLPGHELAVFS